MIEIERELTFLAKYLPADLDQHDSLLITDSYIPATVENPALRLRRKGDRYEMTKKVPLAEGDFSQQTEHTIELDWVEYQALAACPGRGHTKRRYFYDFAGHRAEIDVYQGPLAGLVVIDFEFADEASLRAFSPPEICLVDVSDLDVIAGGRLAGKSYGDIQQAIEAVGYKRLDINEES